jgi:hypothetical protein
MPSRALPWQRRARAYAEVRLRYVDEHQDFLRIYMTEFRSMCVMGKPVHGDLYRLMEQCEAQVAQVLASAVGRGELREIDPELGALTVVDLVRGLMERRLRHSGRQSGPEDTDFALDLICRAFERREPEARKGPPARTRTRHHTAHHVVTK